MSLLGHSLGGVLFFEMVQHQDIARRMSTLEEDAAKDTKELSVLEVHGVASVCL